MNFYHGQKFGVWAGTAVFAILIVLAAELIYIKLNGRAVPVPDIHRDTVTIGGGQPLRYAIIGDSTAVGQGGDYTKGIAIKTAEFLAQKHPVTYQNFAVSGATLADVSNKQADNAARFKPDIVLISAGANDVTHLTPAKAAAESLSKIIDTLQADNSNVRIIFTGSPQMGAVPRFPQPIRYFAGVKTANLNDTLFEVARQKNVTIAPIAEKTGPLFAKNSQLFAPDKFHPNNAGYATWVPVIIEAIDR